MKNEINLIEQEMETVLQELVSESVPETESKPKPISKHESESESKSEASLNTSTEKLQQAQENQQIELQRRQQIKRIIEALLFSSNSPITFNKLREVTDSFHPVQPKILREILEELQIEYMSQQRAFRLEEIADGYLLRTCEEYSCYIDLMYRNKRTEKLSHASAEVLAIIAYKQPITRPQIDAIRGVDSSGILYNLLERQLIEPVGKLEAPGRPTLYGITKDFLKHFGLRDLKGLPPLPIV